MTNTDVVDETTPDAEERFLLSAVPDDQPAPTLQVTWCFQPEYYRQLMSETLPRLYVLLSVLHASSQRKTARYLVEVAQGDQFVSFSSSGPNVVRATLVYDESNDLRRLKKLLLARGSNGYFVNGVLSDESDAFHTVFDYGDKGKVDRLDVETTLTYDVPAGYFSKKLPEWIRDYTGKFWQAEAFDDCADRKRFLKTGVFFPLVVVFNVAFRVVMVAFRLICGMDRTPVESFIHPLKEDNDAVLQKATYSRWFFKALPEYPGATRTIQKPRFFVWWIINPAVQLGLFLVTFIISSWHITRNEQVESLIGWSWYETLAVTVGSSVTLVLAALLIMGFAMLLGAVIGQVWPDESPFDRLSKWWQARQRRLDEEARQAALKAGPKDLRLVSQLVCGDGARPGQIDGKRLPLRLRWRRWRDRAKNKVCKPYER